MVKGDWVEIILLLFPKRLLFFEVVVVVAVVVVVEALQASGSRPGIIPLTTYTTVH